MAKINILFDEKNYAIDDAALAPATDALKAHLETLKEQGVPEFGTDWKFKDTITIDEIKQVASHYPPDEGGSYSYTIYWQNPGGIQIGILDLDTLLSQEPDFVPEGKMGTAYQVMYKPKTTYSGDIWFYFDRSELTDYGYEIFSQIMPDQVPTSQDQLPGWFLAENQEVVKTGPTMPAVSESSGINLEYVAPLFDVPGADGDLPITLDGAVYKIDSTKLEPATNSFIAHLETLKGGESGGVIEYGKEITFKKDITAADFEYYLENAAAHIQHPQEGVTLFYLALYDNQALDVTGTKTVLEGTSPIYGMSVGIEGGEQQYGFAINGQAVGAPIENGWFKIEYEEDDTAIYVPMDTPPTIVIPEGAIMSADLATTSVFFDLGGGGSGNSGDTKIVINGVEYWVDSAKLADAKSALNAAFEALQSGGTN